MRLGVTCWQEEQSTDRPVVTVDYQRASADVGHDGKQQESLNLETTDSGTFGTLQREIAKCEHCSFELLSSY